jgi:hypothetical protein
MVAHCSDMQDLSRHTIPRHLQDTEVPLYPRHYSYSSNYYTGLIIPTLYQYRRYQCRIYPSLSRHAIPRWLQDTALLLHLAITPLSLDSSRRTHQYQYRWPRYCIYAPIPQHQTRSLTMPGPRTRYRLPRYGYIGTLLYLHSSTSASAVSHGYYKQIRPTQVNPDPRPRPFLATLDCTALGYVIPVLPILVIQSHSRHGIRTVIRLAIIGLANLASWIYFSTG